MVVRWTENKNPFDGFGVHVFEGVRSGGPRVGIARVWADNGFDIACVRLVCIGGGQPFVQLFSQAST